MYSWKCLGCESLNPYPEITECPQCGREISPSQKELLYRVEFLKEQAEMGNLYAAESLYSILKQGNHIGASIEESVQWLGFAAENGSPTAQFELGKLYFSENDLIPQNDDEAFKWFVRSLNSGYPYAKRYIAYCYLYGDGVTQDEAKAISLLKEAAEEGDPDSMELLGRCYRNGIGVEENDEEGFYWLESASEVEDYELSSKAAYELGCYYYFGEVTKEDEEAALPYLDSAYRDGIQMAGVYLGVIFYNNGHEKTIQAAKNIWTQIAQSEDEAASERAQQYLDKAFN